MRPDPSVNTSDDTERLRIDPAHLPIEVGQHIRASSSRLSYATYPPVVAEAYKPE